MTDQNNWHKEMPFIERCVFALMGLFSTFGALLIFPGFILVLAGIKPYDFLIVMLAMYGLTTICAIWHGATEKHSVFRIFYFEKNKVKK